MTKLTHRQRHAFTSISTGFAAAMLVIILSSLVVFIFARGSAYFWPMTIYEITTRTADDITKTAFEISSWEQAEIEKNLNSRLASQFVSSAEIAPEVGVERAAQVSQILLVNGMTKLGRLVSLSAPSNKASNYSALSNTDPSISVVPFDSLEKVLTEVDVLSAQLDAIQLKQLAPLHGVIADFNRSGVSEDAPARTRANHRFMTLQKQANEIAAKLAKYYLVLSDAENISFKVYLRDIDELYQPNEMNVIDKTAYTFQKIGMFLGDIPKQASTSGGVFPALFGTVLMVLLMAVLVAPLGIMAAIYLHEYATDNAVTAFIRISISNMAGVPSVVYGVFGLGFFVYFVGGSIDALFYADKLPSPTFGAPGLFWASLTMALLTLPVVIVSTEEGLRRVPSGLRAGAYALGATKLETITKTIVPIASPGMITGLILAVARAAGEVAPLILVGAVKFAPTLPVDGDFPFLHLDRQFMHLGVFIYDGAFHNQTNTQGSAMMFASCLLLLLIVFVLNLFAIIVRNKLRKRYMR